MEETQHFWSNCIDDRYRRLVKEAFDRFPDKIKKLILKQRIFVTDMFDKSANPTEKIEMERLGCYIPPRAIFVKQKTEKGLNDLAFIGLVVHEVSHAKIYFTSPLIRFLMMAYLIILYNRLPFYLKGAHRFLPEEMYANYQAKKWGFDNELIALYNGERYL